jgi:rhodanese-related sulfurtransferase
MAPFPLLLNEILGHWGQYAVYLIIGVAFGAMLEMAGFGKSTKLAAQFYFKDQTVLKVMFGAIVVAMLFIFLTSGLGLLDYNLVWVNPTYLWPGIVGGLIMGAGFIIGGFCPGTSLVAAATLKLDGIFFTLGVFFGIFIFGESVGSFEEFFNSSYMGRFTLPQLFTTSTGIVVIGVVVMALAAFFFAEHAERIFGHADRSVRPKWRFGAAGGVLALGIVVLFVGQPTTEDRWSRLAPDKQPLLENRSVQIHPGELLDVMHNDRLNLVMVDVRSETDFNRFHILDAENVPLADLPAAIPEMQTNPANTVYVLMSNDESTATDAWMTMVAESVPNVYILSGGVNGWLETFADEEFRAASVIADVPDDALRYRFGAALGDRYAAANPSPEVFELEYEPKVVLQSVRGARSGGCG